MIRPLLYIVLTFLPLLTTSQQILPSNLPQCAAQCTVLQQGQTGCLPAGGAPTSNQQTYQSCFCQSALLTQLYQNQAVQLCNTCDTGDMNTIQNWYKNFCGKGGAPLPGGNQQNNNNNNQQQGQTTTSKAPGPTQSATKQSSSQHSAANADNQGNWFSTHWRWVLMLIILLIGLIVIGVAGHIFHRRYHRKRMSKWSTGPGSQPNISTWGPGQSVHDLGWTNREGDAEKTAGSSGQGGVAGVREPESAATRGSVRKEKEGRRSRPWSKNFF